jgi:asparagine synthase (glutamine-hydrolysing)
MSVRPMFYSYNNSSITISSLLCGLTHTKDKKYRIDQGTYMSFVLQNDRLTHTPPKIYKQQPVIADVSLRDIKIVLTNAVKCRLMSDRPIGAFLSGGLDSSLVCLLASNELRKYGKVLQTFSIGALDSPDKLWAEKVAAIIKSEHTHVPFDQDDAITYVDDVIKCVETYDITTIRASTPQYMLAKYVSENTDVKVILSGDGSDELLMGYLYNYNAPSEVEAFLDNIKLINNIHLYDGLRTDRTISHHGLEVRLPFLDYNVVQLYMSIKPSLKLPRHNRMEKYILRQAFDCALPYEILFRTKCAFSDGVSNSKSSWYKRLKNKFDTDEIEQHEYTHVPPVSQESLYYRNRFTELFGKESEKIFKYYWMPAWSNTDDPSARTLTLPNYVNNY